MDRVNENKIVSLIVKIINNDYNQVDADTLTEYVRNVIRPATLRLCFRDAIYKSVLFTKCSDYYAERDIYGLDDLYEFIFNANTEFCFIIGMYSLLEGGNIFMDEVQKFMDKNFYKLVIQQLNELINTEVFYARLSVVYIHISFLYSSESVNKFENDVLSMTETISDKILERYSDDKPDELFNLLTSELNDSMSIWKELQKGIVKTIIEKNYDKFINMVRTFMYYKFTLPVLEEFITSEQIADVAIETVKYLRKTNKYVNAICVYVKMLDRISSSRRISELDFIQTPQFLCQALYNTPTNMLENLRNAIALLITKNPGLRRDFLKRYHSHAVKNILSNYRIEREIQINELFMSLDKRVYYTMLNFINRIPLSLIHRRKVESIPVCIYTCPEPLPASKLSLCPVMDTELQNELHYLKMLNPRLDFSVSPYFGHSVFEVRVSSGTYKIIGNTAHFVIAKYASKESGTTRDEIERVMGVKKLSTIEIEKLSKYKIITVDGDSIFINNKLKNKKKNIVLK